MPTRMAADLLSILPPGVWASTVGQMAGVKVPLVAMHHAYVVTERIEGIQVSDGTGFSSVGGLARSGLSPALATPSVQWGLLGGVHELAQ